MFFIFSKIWHNRIRMDFIQKEVHKMQKMGLSVTHSDNKINIKHNNRSFEEKEWGHTTNSHINRDLTKYNTTFIKQDIKEAYQEAFGEALDEYNAKQKRQDRKIDDYYEYVKGLNDQHKKKGKSTATTKYNVQDEIILTIGNKETWDDLHSRFLSSINDKQEAERHFIEYKKKLSDEIFKGFLDDFQAKHKHLHVFNAVAHYDEQGAPHMHLTFFGKAEGMKKGLRLQPRTTRAIAQDLDGDFYAKMLESDQKKYDLVKENRERKKQGLKPLQSDRKGDMSAGKNVYTQFLAETKQILIDKAREVGFEYEAVGKHDFGDMDHFKEAMAQKKEAFDKEINEYKQEKQEEISKLEAEINDKQKQAQEADKTAEEANQAAKEATKAKDEASREERIARQNAELAQAQAESFRKDLEKLKAEKEAQESELSELSEKIADQTLELEEAKEEKELIEADKSFFKEQVQENISKISEQSAKIKEQEAKISKNEAFMEQQNRQHDEQIDFLARRNKALSEIEQVSKVSYSDKNVVKAFGTVTIGQDHYENLKKKAGLFESIKRFANNLVSTIKETSVYKEMKATLQAEIEHWKGLFNAEKAKNADLEKEKSKLKEDNDRLRHEISDLHYQDVIGRDIGKMCEKYLTQEEKNKLCRKLDARAKDRAEEEEQLKRDDFSYDYER